MVLTSGIFTRAVMTAFATFFMMMLFWPWLVLEPAQKLRNTHVELNWDAALHVDRPKQIMRTERAIYDLEAENLRVLDTDSAEVLLTGPKMMATWQDGSWLTIAARAGVFNKETEVLQLITKVRIQDARGSDLTTQSAVVRMRQQMVEGFSPISGRIGQNIDMVAAGFRLRDRSARYEFLGATEMTFSSLSEANQ